MEMGRWTVTTSKTALILMLIASAFLACDKQTDDIVADQPGLNPATLDAGDRDVKPGKCPAEFPGPALVEVAAPDGTRYCIDRTEVTQRDYFEFLDAVSKTGTWDHYAALGLDGDKVQSLARPDACGDLWLIPGAINEPPCDSAPYAFDFKRLHPDNPIACVDWCSASAYCLWAGKRLCGAVGGGAVNVSENADATKNQWFNACSQGGKTKYSYGDAVDLDRCAPGGTSKETLADGGLRRTAEAVESHPDCHGTEPGFDQVLNMSGSVAEWIDRCKHAPDQPSCLVHPGETPYASWCAASDTPGSRLDYDWIGFRCCFDL